MTQSWFDIGLQRKIGCGNTVRFWKDEWCCHGLLKTSFHKLFHLSTQKNCSLKDMSEWADGVLNWSFTWRRQLSNREALMVAQLRRFIGSFQLLNGTLDSWIWNREPEGLFTVQSAYKLIKRIPAETSELTFKLLWKSRAPSNVCVFGWRLLLDRLPTKVNLSRREILSVEEDLRCVLCRQGAETANHVFATCTVASSLWAKYLRWLGGISVLPGNCRDHFLQHMWPGLTAKQNEALTLVWLALTWSIWTQRNEIIFNWQTLQQIEEIFYKSQIQAWHWLCGRVKGFQCSLYDWITQPILCLQAVQ